MPSLFAISVLLCAVLGVLAPFLSIVPSRAAEGSLLSQATAPVTEESLFLYAGTYTRGESRGIYLLRLSLSTGNLELMGLAAESENPSFLAVHPSGRLLYAVNEVAAFDGQQSGAVSAFSINPDKTLTLLNQQASGGAGPCYASLDSRGRNLLVANYGGGSVAVLPIQEDGRLASVSSFVQHEGSSVDPRRQQKPHAHYIRLDPGNRFALAADLGLDRILVYRFDASRGRLDPHDPPWAATAPGAGPRHLAFHPSGRYVYAINELNSTVTAYAFDASRGTLEEVQTISTLPGDVEETNHTAEVLVHPSGRFLYGSNRGHDSIAILRLDPESGRMTYAGYQPTQGRTPRNFNLDPTGRFLVAANQGSHSIVVFRIDGETGLLEPTGRSVEVPTPVCIQFLPVSG